MTDIANGLAVLAIDIDEFTQVNDNFDHAAGNQALRVVARELKRNTGRRRPTSR